MFAFRHVGRIGIPRTIIFEKTETSFMKNIKKIIVIILALLQLLSPGCGQEKNEPVGESPLSNQAQEDATPNHVTAEHESKNKKLIIDADIRAANLSNVMEIQLVFSDMYLSRIVEEFVRLKNPYISEISSDESFFSMAAFNDEVLLLSFSANKNGFVNYLDVQNDFQCNIHEVDHLYDDGFFTDLIPVGMSISSLEAAELAASFLEKYTCFSFEPWNVLAADAIDGSRGCYYVFLQANYSQIPVVQKSAANAPNINVLVLISSDGVFQFSGMLLLEPSDERNCGTIVPFTSVTEQFSKDFAQLSLGETITVTNISLCYVSEAYIDGSIILKPAWCFYCVDRRMKLESWETNEGPITKKYIVAYYAENGAFCGVYY